MEATCPVCGAPLENGKCSYCNYQEAVQQTQQPTGEISQGQAVNNTNQMNNQMNQAPVYANTVSTQSKGTALVLCILLGYIGVHRFYVGKIGTGILYFLTVGLFGIGWIWDIICIASGRFTDNNGLTLK